MKAGSALDGFAFAGERRASFADDRVELLDRSDVFVDDGLVDEGPQGFRRLQLRRVGRKKNEPHAVGTLSPASPCQPALSMTSTMVRSTPAFAIATRRGLGVLSPPPDRRGRRGRADFRQLGGRAAADAIREVGFRAWNDVLRFVNTVPANL